MARHDARQGVTSFRPTIPDTISATQTMRNVVAGSLKIRMPTTTVPTVPMPVQIA